MPLQADEILKVLREQRDFLKEKYHIRKIGIFGSFARNESNENSDIDFLIEFDTPLETYIANRNAAIEYFKKIFGREVDIANPESLKPHFKDRILKQALYA